MAYAKVEETFWHDPLVRSLTEPGRTLFFYLLTCPHKNRLGCFVLDPMYAAADLQWNQERVIDAMEELQRRGRIEWDAVHRVVFIRRHAKHNTLENPQVVKGAIADLRAMPDTHLLTEAHVAFKQFKRAHYRELFVAFDERLAQQFGQRLDEPTPPTPPQPLAERSARQPVTATATATATAKATVTDPVTEASPPGVSSQIRLTGSPPDTGARDRSIEEAEDDAIATLADEFPEALRVLQKLQHRGGKPATVATIRARILFPDSETSLADPALRGAPLAERIRMFAGALLEYAEQGGKEWSTRVIVGYMGRLRRTRGEREREEAKRQADANGSKAADRAAAREAVHARDEAAKRALEAEAVERGYVAPGDPMALVRELSSAKSMRQGSAT